MSRLRILPAIFFLTGSLAFGNACVFDASNTASGGSDPANNADAGENGLAPDATPIPPDECPVDADFVCATGTPDAPWTVTGDILLNTDTDSRCRTILQSNNTPICLVFVETLSIRQGSSLRAVGGQPLLIASADDLTIDGSIDVSSANSGLSGASANAADCNPGISPDDHWLGGGGGAGGSYQGPGGSGGTGNQDGLFAQGEGGVAGDVLALPTLLRGGCPGHEGENSSRGKGGDSGGALKFIVGGSFTLGQTGRILANGAGGEGAGTFSGGGGAGSGGTIDIRATALSLMGEISANGGGGGGGGNEVNRGGNGEDGSSSLAADGGDKSGSAGRGGVGSSSESLIYGGQGDNGNTGGGGGGGGAGFILLSGQVVSTASISPAPIFP